MFLLLRVNQALFSSYNFSADSPTMVITNAARQAV
jgi:hypothetical protein